MADPVTRDLVQVPEVIVCVPSYKRPQVETLKYVPDARVYVSEREADLYREANPGAEIITVPPRIQGNVARVRNWMLDHQLSQGKAVCMMDDDLRSIAYWEGGMEYPVLPSDLPEFLERFTLMAIEFGCFLWGVNIARDQQNYREHTPFSLSSPILGPFCVHLPGSSIRYDERLPLKEDYDLCLQHLNVHRRVLRVNKYHYIVKQAEQPGGCASYRTLKAERDQFEILRNKWGSEIVRRDASRNGLSGKGTATRKVWDINPVIKPPIKGV
jgi:hypothetical protein